VDETPRLARQVYIWIDQQLRLASVQGREHQSEHFGFAAGFATINVGQEVRPVKDHFRVAGELSRLFLVDEEAQIGRADAP
jgi:hypothetical protein